MFVLRVVVGGPLGIHIYIYYICKFMTVYGVLLGWLFDFYIIYFRQMLIFSIHYVCETNTNAITAAVRVFRYTIVFV